ncbi:hypothetical protein [Streptomyces sp. NPDC047869]|uniref:hypothetical protein n=1 Tax=Streptomyces sp. NPDC047869 TaxID=3154709 RepID=UPI0034547945
MYALLDDKARPVYLGITTTDVDTRAYRHWTRRLDPQMERWNPRLTAWLRTLDRPPRATFICEAPYDQRHVVEAAAVLAYRQAGYPLPLNVRVGQAWPEDSRARIAEGMRRYRARQREVASA